MNQVLIVDDEEKLRNLLARIISLEGFDVLQAPDCKKALKKLEQARVDVVFCDVLLPDGNGVEFTKKIREKFPHTEVILLTAYGNIADGVQAIKNGAFDYVTKGDDNSRIVPLLHRAIEKVMLARRVADLEKQLGDKHSFESITACSRSILAVIEQAKKVSGTDTTVLLTGETGTGKEVFARAIHQSSPRRHKNFVAINCSVFSRELLQSEMFGYKTGAFTGANKDKKGLFEEAGEGTIFLDEIGEMSMELQAQLLRVLETGTFIRMGETKTTAVDVRIMAATNRDLKKETVAGTFREDLFYRISVFQIPLPPLRDRQEDIDPLVWYFARWFAAKTNKKITAIAPEFMEALHHHSFPGNVRELKNILERSVILATSSELTVETLPEEIRLSSISQSGEKPLSAFDLASAEKLHILKVLNHTGGNKTEAARLMNIGLTTLYRKLDEYHIR